MLRFVIFIFCVAIAHSQTYEELCTATEAIWQADYSAFSEDEITYDLGSNGDLFQYVNESHLDTGSYPEMRVMLVLFNPVIGEPDPDLSNDIELFLDAILSRECMILAQQYLVSWGLASEDATEWRDDVREFWFGKYSRSNDIALDSSGFEQVFQGQISVNRTEVVGFHNWVQAYQEEQRDLFVYGEGYANCGNNLVGFSNFKWRDALKPLSSMWIGTSPELEIALYTVCHLARRGGDCEFTLAGGVNTTVTSYPWLDTDMISSAYPRCSFDLSDADLGAASEAILQADTNSFTQDEFSYDVNGTTLFTSVDETRFQTGLYPALLDLLNKFNPQIGEEDPNLDAEIDLFLDELMDTEVMDVAQQYLADWGRASTNATTWRADVREYWFGKYSRSGGVEDSSGFEHAFQGQIREGGAEVTGFNNWVQTYKEEQSGNFVYGYSDADCGDDLIQMNGFSWYNASSPISSIWIGASPELEIALYTLCFNVRRNEPCNIMLNGNPETIVNFDIGGTNFIGSAYMRC